ncbi:hypothetical protein VEE57_14970 [Escherichia coli]|nr:hypothetical protein VEE57_14970 [Escherichia coli]
MTVAYIAIGSNLASPLEQVNAALKALGDIPESHILTCFFVLPHPTAGAARSTRLLKRSRGAGNLSCT